MLSSTLLAAIGRGRATAPSATRDISTRFDAIHLAANAVTCSLQKIGAFA
jgi:hypothetical protein